MKTFLRLLSLVACVSLTGCGMMGGSSEASAPPPAPVASNATVPAATDVLRVGDKISVHLSGVPDPGYFEEHQIPSSGEITVPLLSQPFRAAGRTAGDLADDITNAYKTQKIYSNPTVTVISEERFVNVGGDVRSPSRVQYTSDLTLLGAINSCGGFDEYANKRTVRIIRGNQTIVVDAIQAARVPGADPALYPGDQITVSRTMF